MIPMIPSTELCDFGQWYRSDPRHGRVTSAILFNASVVDHDHALNLEPLSDGKHWKVLSDYTVVSRGHKITVKAGFITDLASTPCILWAIVPPFGKYTPAVVIHDWLYTYHDLERAEADRIFLDLMARLGVPYSKRYAMFLAVRMFGGANYDKEPAFKFRLGALPPAFDRRTLLYSKYVPHERLRYPVEYDWLRNRSKSWPMFGNDRIGDCVFAAAGHAIINWTDDSGRNIEPSEYDIVKSYSDVTGYDPITGMNDQGTQLIDALKYWRNTGIAGRKILAFLRIDPRNADAVKHAIFTFGCVYGGWALPKTIKSQTQWHIPWYGPRGPARKGGLGGHCIMFGAYAKESYTAITWAARQSATLDWFEEYAMELYAIVTEDWVNAQTLKSPNGFDIAALLADLKRVEALS